MGRKKKHKKEPLELIPKESVKFVPFEKDELNWFAGIEIDGELHGWLHWIESTDGTICMISANATTPMGRMVATSRAGAESVCRQLQELFERDEIGWTNCNLRRG